MVTLEIPLAEQLAETAHWSDDPPVRMEEQEFDILAFELWHLGNGRILVTEPHRASSTAEHRTSFAPSAAISAGRSSHSK